ncbi:MAG: capsular polysaccharide biosynthesis protein [Clostridia bacterium]|nr:capsular polysaccharide biosynthesis protein [Clostridia bacterium]
MIQNMNLNKIRRVLKAAGTTPYYSKVFEELKLDVENIETYEDFLKIPITTKEIYKRNNYDFIVSSISDRMDFDYLRSIKEDYKAIDKYLERFNLNMVITSGSTGIPIEVLHSKSDDIRNYFTLNLYRIRQKAFDITSKYLWILPMNKKTQSIFYNKDISYLLDGNAGIQYLLVKYDDESLGLMHKAVREHSVKWMTGSPSAVAEYASYLKRHGLSYEFQYIELHSEPCLDWQKKLIEEVFNITPRCIYSSNEVNFIAGTCSHGCYHILDENAFVEFVDKDYGDKASKKILVTGLNYLDTPFLRYDIGDLGKEVQCKDCEYGDKPAIMLTGYRDSDMIMRSNGERLEPYIVYDAVFFLEKSLLGEIGYYQVQQTDYDKFLFCFEQLPVWDEAARAAARSYLTEFMSEAIGDDIEVRLDVCRRYDGYNKHAEAKYRRFKSLTKGGEVHEHRE